MTHHSMSTASKLAFSALHITVITVVAIGLAFKVAQFVTLLAARLVQ